MPKPITAALLSLIAASLVLCPIARGQCPGDLNDDNRVTVDELVIAVQSALEGCRSPTPTHPLPTPTSLPQTRFTDNGDGTVADHATGLLWEVKDRHGGLHDVTHTYPWSGVCSQSGDRCQPREDALQYCPRFAVGCASCPPGDSCLVADGQGGGVTIFSWVAELNLQRFAGHDDWRLPSIDELQTILAEPFECRIASPCVDRPFDNGATSFTAADSYWSATTPSYSPAAAWYARFNDGFTGIIGKTNSLPARAVRADR